MTTLVRILAPVAPGPGRGQSIQALVDVVHGLNVSWLKAHPDAPRIYSGAVRYAVEPPHVRETFATAPAALVQGWGDCDDLAPWRSAELVARDGVAARPLVREVRPGLWHVVVRHPDGRLEDPSRLLGMRGPG